MVFHSLGYKLATKRPTIIERQGDAPTLHPQPLRRAPSLLVRQAWLCRLPLPDGVIEIYGLKKAADR